jgi:hypothetical protein
MRLPYISIQSRVSPELQGEVDTHLRGRWLLIARIAWVALVVPTLGVFVVGLPIYFKQLQTACIGAAACALNGALNPTGMRALQNLGFSVGGYAAYTVALYVVVSLVWSIIGLMIFCRRSDDWMALFVSLFLVTYYPGIQNGPAYALAMIFPAWDLPGKFVSLLVLISLGLFLYLFPDGRFVPRWTCLLLIVGIAWLVPINFFPDSPFDSTTWPPLPGLAVWLGFVGSLVYAQIYRYRRVSNPVQRRQTKWVVLGGTAAIVGVIGLYISKHLIFSTLSQHGSIYEIVNITGYLLVLLPIPLSIGVAILHSRLWDIDVLINRALVYGMLTGTLVLVYVSSIFVLQYLLREFTSQTSDVSIAGSTLAIAALFQPLRHHIQRIIDKHFYRRKYDAARTLAAFTATLRDEVDLSQLQEHLLAVVEETMQPKHVSLWIRQPVQHEKQNYHASSE